MQPKTLKALRASIAEYEKKLAALEGEGGVVFVNEVAVRLDNNQNMTFGASTCPLCSLFRKKDCIHCPVAKNTGRKWCEGSPYIVICGVLDSHSFYGIEVDFALFKQAVTAELAFLKSLLPGEGKETPCQT